MILPGRTLITWLWSLMISAALAMPLAAQQLEGFSPDGKELPAFTLTSFYDMDVSLAGKHAGEIIKKEPVRAPEGAVAWRVMYISRTWDNKVVPVTGIIVAPKGESAKPRPILSWAHGTTGGARGCAPSLAEDPAQNLLQRDPSRTNPIDIGIPYLTEFLKRGFVVVATDYYGLGGPGVHQYMVGETSARNALDLARAARTLREIHTGTDLATMGWSVGGQTATFTGELEKQYAPEFKPLGVIGIAPATTPSFREDDLFGAHYLPYIYLIARSFNSAYSAPLDGFTDRGRGVLETAGLVCVKGVYFKAIEDKTPTVQAGFKPSEVAAWNKAFASSDSGSRKSSAPVLVVQGTSDRIVWPDHQKLYLPRACKVGTTVKVSWYEGKTHRSVLDAAEAEILSWVDDRLAGKPAPNDCGK